MEEKINDLLHGKSPHAAEQEEAVGASADAEMLVQREPVLGTSALYEKTLFHPLESTTGALVAWWSNVGGCGVWLMFASLASVTAFFWRWGGGRPRGKALDVPLLEKREGEVWGRL